MGETQNTHYAITYYFEHQLGRFMIKEFAVVYRYEYDMMKKIVAQAKI